MDSDDASRPSAIVSSDCHAGADLRDYKPYLERRWHDAFDAWASTYTDAWARIDTESEYKAGVSSFLSPLNWDSTKRLEVLESQGIVAEVLFPNTTPPFSPNGLLAAPGPRSRDEYERRWAGIRAHNRWLKDFCQAAPGRRFGVAQLFVDDIDDAVAEIRWARESGLSQVLLPSDHHLKLHNLYERRLEPIWSVCEELDMPIGRHGSVVASDLEPESIDEAHACGVFETTYFGHRTLYQLVLGGVFERHPRLKVVFTELGASNWVFDTVGRLDGFAMGAGMEGTIPNLFAGRAVGKLSMRPSDYVRRHCYFGATASINDFEHRHELGIDKLMWGADFPHHEGTVPYTLEVLRETVTDIPDDELRAILAGNAAALYGGDMTFLQGVADRIGFTPEQVATPTPRDELPADPNFHIMFARPTNVFTGAEG
jgi:predicted TIM-barrel fold metal-dependent hydrolase